MRASLPSLFVVVCVCAAPPSWGGTLDRVRKTTSEPRKASKPSSSDAPHHDHGSYDADAQHDDSDGDLTLFAVQLIGFVLTSPWWGPFVAVDDEWGRDNGFRAHPYAEGSRSWVTLPDSYEDLEAAGGDLALQVAAEWGTVSGGVSRVAGRVKVETDVRLGISGGFERLSEGRDSLDLVDGVVFLRFAESQRVVFRSGVGVRVLLDRNDPVFGGVFTYGFDAFPRAPLVLSGDLSVGWLGEAVVAEARGTLGATWGGAEIFAGWRQLNFYNGAPSVALGGPVIGGRGWF